MKFKYNENDSNSLYKTKICNKVIFLILKPVAESYLGQMIGISSFSYICLCLLSKLSFMIIPMPTIVTLNNLHKEWFINGNSQFIKK